MSEHGPITVPDVRDYAKQVEENRPRPDGHGGHMDPLETVREDEYRGHKIVIRTTYEIEVDGHPVRGHVGITNDGRVHYHAMPNLSFPSAVAMVRQLIDAFPDDFADGGDGHDHDHQHPMG